jgi:integrase
MPDKRVTVWVQKFKDRPALMLQWNDPDTGRRKSKSAKTANPKEAEKARADLEYELNHGRYQEASRMTWERFRELFEAEYVAHKRPKTRRRYAYVLDLFEEVARPARLKSVNERMVSAFKGELARRRTRGRVGMMPSTIKVTMQFLRCALRWAAEQKMMTACPKFTPVKVPKKKPQPIPAESFENLFAKAPDATMQAYLLCGWLAGLRLSEAYALRWEATDKAPYVDLCRGRIILPAEFAKSAEDQWVPIDAPLRDALEALPRHGTRVFHFTDRNGRRISVEGVSHRVRTLAHRAGVKLTMHSLRKGFGCRYAGKVPAQVLQRLMRHANISITMDYYANVDVAVEEAVWGSKRNSSRNSEAAAGIPVDGPLGLNGYPESGSGET